MCSLEYSVALSASLNNGFLNIKIPGNIRQKTAFLNDVESEKVCENEELEMY